jgi:hypothetical protein
MGTGVHSSQPHDRAARNLRTALMLAALALAFAVGFVVRMWLTS